MIILLIITFIVIFISAFYFKRRHYRKLGDQFPGPRTIPLLGNGHYFVNKSPEQIFNKVNELQNKYGETFRLWFGPDLWIIDANPQQIEGYLTNPKITMKSIDYKFLKPWLGNGLLLSMGSKWFKRRRIITPAFHFKILEQFVDVFDAQSTIMIKKLGEQPPGEIIDMVPYIKLCTLDIICETAMGTKIDAQLDSDTEYLKAVNKVAEIIYRRLFDSLAQNDLYFSMTRFAKTFERCVKTAHEFTENIIIKRREELLKSKANEKVTTFNFDEFAPKKKMALLDILLMSTIDGKPLNNAEVREEVDTFMFAGHDTTSCGIAFLLYNLAKYQDVQEKVYEELIEVTGSDPKKAISMRQLGSLQYFDLVMKESLRLYPPAPFIGRQIKDELEINGITYPANTNISISVMGLHRNPKAFPDPEKFLPERFSEERFSDKVNPFSYIPFSAGPRNCIGQKFAQLEMKVLTSKILKNFKIRLADENEELVMLSEIVLKSKNGVRVYLEQRV